MRHRNNKAKLNRTPAHKKAMLNNLVASLFEKNVVVTTTAKAKEARKLADRYITIAKSSDDFNARRKVAKDFHATMTLKKLFDEIAPLYKNRKGGYTRIVKVGVRRGDGGSISIIELVEKPAVKKEKK